MKRFFKPTLYCLPLVAAFTVSCQGIGEPFQAQERTAPNHSSSSFSKGSTTRIASWEERNGCFYSNDGDYSHSYEHDPRERP